MTALINMDLASIELQMIQHLPDNREDLHTTRAKTLFGVTNPTPQQRRAAKAWNYASTFDMDLTEGRDQ